MEPLTATERIRIRNQTADESVKLAVAGRWKEAATLNRELLEQIGGDVETYNRLGKALSELGKIGDARSAYQDALRIQPGNSIAVRNLNKLAVMEDSAAAAPQVAAAGAVRQRPRAPHGNPAHIDRRPDNDVRLGIHALLLHRRM